jgi:ABC-type transport system substrate-binding protein
VKAGELATVLKEQYAGDYITNVRPNAGNTGNGLYDWTYKSEHTNGLFSVHNTKNMPPDEHLNDLCLRAVAAFDKTEQDAINAEFQQYLHDMAYWVPLGCPTHILVTQKAVQGWGYHSSDTQIVQSGFAADYWLSG